MKNMKKLLTLGLALTMTLTLLAGCGTEKVTLQILPTEYAVEDYAICTAKGSDLMADINAALEEIKADGTAQAIVDKYISGKAHDITFQANAEGKPELHMATNAAFPPYEFYENNEVVGIDAEMAAAIADKLDRKLVIDDMEFDAIIVAITSGKADMGMAGMTVTEDRLKSVDFSTSYATGIQSVIVAEGSKITSVDDLFAEGANTIIGVQTGTTGDLYTTGDIEDAGLGTVQRFNKGADAVQALVTGKVDCVVIDNEPAKAFVEANNK